MNRAGVALQQITGMAYADKYQDGGEPMCRIGAEFSKASGNTADSEFDTLLLS